MQGKGPWSVVQQLFQRESQRNEDIYKKTPPVLVELVVRCSYFLSIVIDWWRQWGNNPWCRGHNWITIHSWCGMMMHSWCSYCRVRHWSDITSAKQKCQCRQSEKYSYLFHGFVSIIEQRRSPFVSKKMYFVRSGSMSARLVRTNGLTYWLARFRFFFFLFLQLYL